MVTKTRLEEAVEEFAAQFHRSNNGNLTCADGDVSVTIFIRKDQGYSWVRNDGDGVTFSNQSFADEQEAMADLATAVWGLRDL